MIKQLCGTCLTNRENSKTGFCINDHDNWIEPEDISIFSRMLDDNGKLNKFYRDRDYNIVDEKYPHVIPMFKELAKKLKTKFRTLSNIIVEQPTFRFIKKFSYLNEIKPLI